MSEQLFYFLSKLLGFVISVDNILILSLLFGVIFINTYKVIARTLLTISIGGLLTLTLFPIGSLLIAPLEKRFPIPQQLPENIAGIIVLGGAESLRPSIVHQQLQFNEAAERVMSIPRLAQKYPNTTLIIASGVRTSIDKTIKGAYLIEQWLKPLLPPTVTVHIEDQSRNTWQNAKYSLKYRTSEHKDDPWLLVSSAAHMPRSVGVFRQLNWNIIPYPVDFQSYPLTLYPHFSNNISVLRRAYHEWVGLLAYYLNGYTNALYPKP